MLDSVSVARRSAAALAALVGAVLLAAPVDRAFAQQPSAPVTVTNRSTSPVPTAVPANPDDPGRNAYQSSIRQPCGLGGDPNCRFVFPVVPPGHRLVIEHITGTLELQAPLVKPVSASIFFFSSLNFNQLSAFSVPVIESGQPFIVAYSIFDQQILIYLDAGVKPVVVVGLFGVHFALRIVQNVTLSGHLIDCTAIPCAPIAQ